MGARHDQGRTISKRAATSSSRSSEFMGPMSCSPAGMSPGGTGGWHHDRRQTRQVDRGGEDSSGPRPCGLAGDHRRIRFGTRPRHAGSGRSGQHVPARHGVVHGPAETGEPVERNNIVHGAAPKSGFCLLRDRLRDLGLPSWETGDDPSHTGAGQGSEQRVDLFTISGSRDDLDRMAHLAQRFAGGGKGCGDWRIDRRVANRSKRSDAQRAPSRRCIAALRLRR